jgi:hypothetical protein
MEMDETQQATGQYRPVTTQFGADTADAVASRAERLTR